MLRTVMVVNVLVIVEVLVGRRATLAVLVVAPEVPVRVLRPRLVVVVGEASYPRTGAGAARGTGSRRSR